MNAPLFSVIIPVFNKWELTAACLRSLHEHTRDLPYEVIVVDNGSHDLTTTDLEPLGKSLFGPAFHHIRYEENKNFAPACNAGAALATAPLLFFLNNDTLLTPNFAPPLLHALDNPTIAAVGPLLLYDDNTVQHLGVSLTPQGLTHLYSHFPADHPLVHKERRLQALTAAALLVPKSSFLQAGSFYEGYKNGFEDLELSIKLRQAGKKLLCVSTSRIIHLESQSQGRKTHDTANAQLFSSRCGKDFFIDIHHHGLRDGLRIAVNGFYGINLLLPQAEEAALLLQIKKSPVLAWNLMEQHPLWLAGRAFLAELLENEGHYQESLSLRIAIANLFPTQETFAALVATAAKTGDEEFTTAMQAQHAAILQLHQDSSKAAAAIQPTIHKALAHNDTALLNIMKAALPGVAQ